MSALYGGASAVCCFTREKAVINGFAAGALLVMLVDSMIPEATRKGGQAAGLATVLGFAVAFGLA
jgi:ZIP family zinc transporter